MAQFKITGPDGAVYKITAPDDASDTDLSAFIEQHIAKPKEPEAEPVSAGEMGTDVAKSFGTGLGQGALGLATTFGNLESLTRSGINAGAGMVGLKPPVSEQTILPTYDHAKKFTEGFTGEFYKPQTVPGEYARTLGEFAPAAVGPGGPLAAGLRVAGPALTSETAGQLTKGTAVEPYARAAGALVGGGLPNAAARVVTPHRIDPARTAMVNALENEGVTALTAGQRTGGKALRWVEDATATVPGGGGRATQMQNQAAEQYTRAILRRAGVNADRATPDVIENAFTQIGQEYQNFARQAHLLNSPSHARRLQQIAQRYEQNTAQGSRVPAVRAVVDDLAQRPGLAGHEYGNIRSRMAKAQRAAAATGDTQTAQAFRDIAGALDAQAVRSLPRAARQQAAFQMQTRNQRYRNLIAVEKAAGGTGENAALGLISPGALRGAVQSGGAAGKRDYVRGRGTYADLARAGEAILKPLPSSGTAERGFAQGVINTPGSVIGGVGSGSIEGAIAGSVAPWAAKAATSRTIMSNPIQRWMGNQAIPNAIPNDVDPRIARALALMLAEREQESQPLRGSMAGNYPAQ